MSVDPAPAKVKIEDFASTFRDHLVPLNTQFSYFSSPSMAEEDLRQYLHEPAASLPPRVCAVLPKKIVVILIPFLEQAGPKAPLRISFERVPEARQAPAYRLHHANESILFLAVKEEEVSDYHYSFFSEISSLAGRGWTNEVRDSFFSLVRGELAAKVHGEVDERSWRLKQALLRKSHSKDPKIFKQYARMAFEDTMTLYLHGICCDIDVETGPRQLPSRFIRRRLELLQTHFAPPAGHAVFPEELKRP